MVATPESTSEQQTEREKFWKDEDFIVDPSEAKFNVWDSLGDVAKDTLKKKKKKDK